MIGRLKYRNDFRILYREGRTFKHGPIRVVCRCVSHAEFEIRLAFAIGRTVGKSVTRNRIRRQLRSTMRDLVLSDKPPPKGDYLICVDSSVKDFPKKNIQDSLIYIMKKIHQDLKEIL